MGYRLPCSFISGWQVSEYAPCSFDREMGKSQMAKVKGAPQGNVFDKQGARVNRTKEKVGKESEKGEMSVYQFFVKKSTYAIISNIFSLGIKSM